MATALIGFGSNVGNRLDFCDRTLTLLSLLPHSRLDAVSSLYETEPVDDGAAPGPEWFLNGVAQLETDITPKSLLEVSQEIERALGRDLDHRGGPRTLDLDILFYDDRIIEEPAPSHSSPPAPPAPFRPCAPGRSRSGLATPRPAPHRDGTAERIGGSVGRTPAYASARQPLRFPAILPCLPGR